MEPGPGDRAPAINAALRAARAAGGGTVYLPAGRYELRAPLTIETKVGADERQEVPLHVRLLGAQGISSYDSAATTLIYTGAAADVAVIDVTHARNTTIENLRIEAATDRRFRYGVFFHRTDSALTGRGRLLAPSALNILACAITAGAGAFTCGVRLGDSGAGGDLDQNCDHNRVEGLWVEGATDEPSGPQAPLREGRTAAGVLVAGSQVQGGFFADLHLRRCGTGIFVLDGQLALFGGELMENGGPLGTGPAGRGGGDVVLRTGLRAGHLLQDVVSHGSTHFITSFLEDAESVPATGSAAAWQGDALIAVAVLGCRVTGCQDPGRALELLGNSGPLVLVGCTLGAVGEPPHQVQVGGYTQGSLLLVDSQLNHSGAPVTVRDDGPTAGAKPRFELLGCKRRAADGTEVPLPDTTSAAPRALDALRWTAPRRRADRPVPRGLVRALSPGGAALLSDDTDLVQHALDALAREGGTLALPPACYTVHRTLVLRGARGARLVGVGGRGGAAVLGPTAVRGTILAWAGAAAGPLLVIEDCEDLVLEGLHFTTARSPGESGVSTVNTMIDVRRGRRLWLEDLGTAWLAGNGSAEDQGVCTTFVRIAAQAEQVTVRAVALQQVAGEGVWVDGARGVELSLFIAADSRCLLRMTGGEAAWLGGGGGNSGGRYGSAAAVVQLTAGRLYMAGIELQDSEPARALSVSGQVVLAGVNLLLPTPADRALIDVAGGELLLLGCGLGDAEVGLVPKVRAAEGAQVLSLGSALETRGPADPFLGAGAMVDRGSRALDREQLGHWPNQVQLLS